MLSGFDVGGGGSAAVAGGGAFFLCTESWPRCFVIKQVNDVDGAIKEVQQQQKSGGANTGEEEEGEGKEQENEEKEKEEKEEKDEEEKEEKSSPSGKKEESGGSSARAPLSSSSKSNKNAVNSSSSPTSSSPFLPMLPWWFTAECRRQLLAVAAPELQNHSYSQQQNRALTPDRPPSSIGAVAAMSEEQLRARLTRQLEFYFSRENLINDRYLRCQMDADQYVPIKIVANFPKVAQLSTDFDLIVDVLRASSQVQVDESGTKVRPMSKRCTIILREIPQNADENEVRALFQSEDGECPAFMSLAYGLNDSWYVTFQTEEETQRAFFHLQTLGKTFNGKPVFARIKNGGAPIGADPHNRHSPDVHQLLFSEGGAFRGQLIIHEHLLLDADSYHHHHHHHNPQQQQQRSSATATPTPQQQLLSCSEETTKNGGAARKGGGLAEEEGGDGRRSRVMSVSAAAALSMPSPCTSPAPFNLGQILAKFGYVPRATFRPHIPAPNAPLPVLPPLQPTTRLPLPHTTSFFAQPILRNGIRANERFFAASTNSRNFSRMSRQQHQQQFGTAPPPYRRFFQRGEPNYYSSSSSSPSFKFPTKYYLAAKNPRKRFTDILNVGAETIFGGGGGGGLTEYNDGNDVNNCVGCFDCCCCCDCDCKFGGEGDDFDEEEEQRHERRKKRLKKEERVNDEFNKSDEKQEEEEEEGRKNKKNCFAFVNNLENEGEEERGDEEEEENGQQQEEEEEEEKEYGEGNEMVLDVEDGEIMDGEIEKNCRFSNSSLSAVGQNVDVLRQKVKETGKEVSPVLVPSPVPRITDIPRINGREGATSPTNNTNSMSAIIEGGRQSPPQTPGGGGFAGFQRQESVEAYQIALAAKGVGKQQQKPKQQFGDERGGAGKIAERVATKENNIPKASSARASSSDQQQPPRILGAHGPRRSEPPPPPSTAHASSQLRPLSEASTSPNWRKPAAATLATTYRQQQQNAMPDLRTVVQWPPTNLAAKQTQLPLTTLATSTIVPTVVTSTSTLASRSGVQPLLSLGQALSSFGGQLPFAHVPQQQHQHHYHHSIQPLTTQIISARGSPRIAQYENNRRSSGVSRDQPFRSTGGPPAIGGTHRTTRPTWATDSARGGRTPNLLSQCGGDSPTTASSGSPTVVRFQIDGAQQWKGSGGGAGCVAAGRGMGNGVSNSNSSNNSSRRQQQLRTGTAANNIVNYSSKELVPRRSFAGSSNGGGGIVVETTTSSFSSVHSTTTSSPGNKLVTLNEQKNEQQQQKQISENCVRVVSQQKRVCNRESPPQQRYCNEKRVDVVEKSVTGDHQPLLLNGRQQKEMPPGNKAAEKQQQQTPGYNFEEHVEEFPALSLTSQSNSRKASECHSEQPSASFPRQQQQHPAEGTPIDSNNIIVQPICSTTSPATTTATEEHRRMKPFSAVVAAGRPRRATIGTTTAPQIGGMGGARKSMLSERAELEEEERRESRRRPGTSNSIHLTAEGGEGGGGVGQQPRSGTISEGLSISSSSTSSIQRRSYAQMLKRSTPGDNNNNNAENNSTNGIPLQFPSTTTTNTILNNDINVNNNKNNNRKEEKCNGSCPVTAVGTEV